MTLALFCIGTAAVFLALPALEKALERWEDYLARRRGGMVE